MNVKTNGAPDSLRTLARAFSLVDALVEQERASLSDLSARTGLHKSTVHRFVMTMIQYGWVALDSQTDRYSLGPKLLTLCGRAISRTDVRSVARPYLEQLRDLTEESANLGALQSGTVVCLDSVSSRQPLRMSFEAGHPSPFHATGLGKAIAAFLPPAQVDELLQAGPLKRYTMATLVDPDRLRSHLERVRELGYAFDDMELSEQVRCVAAPIFGPDGHAVAAVSVSGPAFRMTLDRLQDIATLLTRAARAISAKLGYRATGGGEEEKE